MKLREWIKEIRREKGWTQDRLAQSIGERQQTIQGLESAGRNLEKAFSVIVKLLPVSREVGLDPVRGLKDSENKNRVKETADDVEQAIDKEIGRANSRRITGRQKKGNRSLLSGRIAAIEPKKA